MYSDNRHVNSSTKFNFIIWTEQIKNLSLKILIDVTAIFSHAINYFCKDKIFHITQKYN